MIFDLDPSKANDFPNIVKAAKALKTIIEALKLRPFVMTTGSRGLHVVVLIKRTCLFDEVREFAGKIAKRVASQSSDTLTTEERKEKRQGRIFIDILRNAYAQTSVAPYSVRAKKSATVATPLEWEALDDKYLSPTTYNIENIFRRLGQKDDPWKNMADHAKSVEKAAKRMEREITK